MDQNEKQLNKSNLMNIYSELKQKYSQIYKSNKLRLIGLEDNNEQKSQFSDEKYLIYSGSKRIFSAAEYSKITNSQQNENKDNQNVQPEQKVTCNSETDSLSFIKENDKFQIQIMNSVLWHELLKQQQDIFQILDYEDFIITSFSGKYQPFHNIDVLLDQGYTSKIYQGFCFQRNENIAIKFQLYNPQELVENQYQYSLHHYIYSLYPSQYLQIFYPIYVHQDTLDSIQIVSKYELGQQNLYNYCINKKIDENEMNLIYRQLLQQILLLHKHNIAHRDIKPQNIIFVKNKGWLLCDFEFSMKYTNQVVVCSIKGTRSFLPPNLYRQSNIQGAVSKQDLFFNDQYALGVTLIVIKYQIKNSNDLQSQILNEMDPNILFLLKQCQKEELLQQNLIQQQQQVAFIQPEIQTTDDEDLQDLQNHLNINQLHSLIQSLQRLGSHDKDLRDQLISVIDLNLNYGRDDYLQLNLLIYENLAIYLPYFKNLIETRILRSSKFWKSYESVKDIRMQLSILKFLQNLGLYETLIRIGKQYLYSNYNLAIHVLIARMLFYLKEYDLVYQEYQQMLKIKEFQYLTSVEQSEFVNFTFQLFHLNLIDEVDIQYVQQFYHKISFQHEYQVYDLYDAQKDTKESFIRYIDAKYKEQTTYERLLHHFQDYIMKFGSCNLSMNSGHSIKLYQLAFGYLELDDLIKFDLLMLTQIKFFTFIVQYQQLLKQTLFLDFLKTQNTKLIDSKATKNSLLKIINFIVFVYSESQQQKLILNLIKQCSVLIYQMRSLRKLNQIIGRVHKLCQQFDLLTFNYYKNVFLFQLCQILFETRTYTSESLLWYRIALWQTKMIQKLRLLLDNSDFAFYYDDMINYWISVRNQRRHDQLVQVFQISSNREKIKQKYEYPLAQIYDSVPLLLKLQKKQRLTACFLYHQNLCR